MKKKVKRKSKSFKKEEEKNLFCRMNEKVKVSQKFVIALSIVSILGFAGIVSQTLFGVDLGFYIESLLMFIIGIGLILEAKMKRLKSLEKGLNSNNITHLTTIIIGAVAIVAGIFSFPRIRIINPAFLAIKGIISIIAIIVIIIQTWFG